MKINENEGTVALRQLAVRHRLLVTSVPEKNNIGLLKVRLSSRAGDWLIYLSDEYTEYHENRKLLGVYMVLDALRTYKTSKDFLEWCTDLEVAPANDTLRQYYMDLANIEKEVQQIIGDYEPILVLIHFDFPFRNETDSKILLREDKKS